MSVTRISWTDVTWNPLSGCTKVSPGCLHCYAETMTHRFRAYDHVPWTVKAQRESGRPAVTLHPERLEQPLHWKRPRRVFVNSMSDLFHPEVPDEYIAEVMRIIKITAEHQYQILTKRPERMLAWSKTLRLPLPNVWLGVSVENQRYADERIPLLLAIHGVPVRFISAEPLLGPVDLTGYEGLDWIICGGESGAGSRPMAEDWVRGIRDWCQGNGVPLHYKQRMEGRRVVHLPELDGRAWGEFPG